MKIEFTKEWCLRMAQFEAETDSDFEVGAPHRAPEALAETHTNDLSQSSNIVFGRFVRLMRRHQHLTLEKLAQDARIEISELVEIEEDTRHSPDPRTVYQLATHFKVPMPQMLQLAGLTVAKDSRLIDEAIRFAARSESVEALNEVERAALEAFVSVLSERKD